MVTVSVPPGFTREGEKDRVAPASGRAVTVMGGPPTSCVFRELSVRVPLKVYSFGVLGAVTV